MCASQGANPPSNHHAWRSPDCACASAKCAAPTATTSCRATSGRESRESCQGQAAAGGDIDNHNDHDKRWENDNDDKHDNNGGNNNDDNNNED